MDTGYVVGEALRQAIVPTFFVFSLSALALQHERKAKMSYLRTLWLFVVAVLLCAIANAAIFLYLPVLVADTGVTAWSLVKSLVLPLLVSVITIHLLWPRQPMQPVATMRQLLHALFCNPSHVNTPLKRVGYVLFWVGALLTVVALLTFTLRWSLQGRRDYFFHVLLNYDWASPYFIAIEIGCVMWLIGFFLSYAHDQTVGRFVHWVKTGQ
jgi:hypothetical protein